MPETGAPIYDMIQRYLSKNRASFHTPGHKGRAGPILGIDARLHDLTELPETASLFDGDDVIERAEEMAAGAFGASMTLFSAGGCTLCIQTMLTLGAGGGRVVFARNAHRSAVHAAALLGIEPVWAWPSGENGQIELKDIEGVLNQPGIRAVYITSPDYCGNLADIKGVSALCQKVGIPLLVDNAHGSHLGAFGLHPLSLGADMTSDSSHKTLPVLTGGAMLHIGRPADMIDKKEAKAAMAMFGSTSPSFPVLASLDLARDWWQRVGIQAYRMTAEAVEELTEAAGGAGIRAASGTDRDPARLTLDTSVLGIDGTAAAEHFRTSGCEPEYDDARYVVFIITPFNTPEELHRLRDAIDQLPVKLRRGYFLRKKEQPFTYKEFDKPVAAMTPRQALLSRCETVDTYKAVGRISAGSACPCPPGIAAVVPGEVITAQAAENLKMCGFDKLVVVLEGQER
jgi:arginine decarboxylase